jgi:hypothetical protein
LWPPKRRHVFVKLSGPKSRQTQSDPEGGIPSGSLELLGRLEGLVGKKNLGQRALVSLSKEITQTSDGLLLLQSTTC